MICIENAGWQKNGLILILCRIEKQRTGIQSGMPASLVFPARCSLSELTVWIWYLWSISWSNSRKTLMGMRQRYKPKSNIVLCHHVLLIQTVCRPWKLRAGWGVWEENAMTFKPHRQSWTHKGIFFSWRKLHFLKSSFFPMPHFLEIIWISYEGIIAIK